MGNYSKLKTDVRAVIKYNAAEEITGSSLQSVLLNIISTLGTYSQFAGVATPSTSPTAIDQNVFYIAVQAGTYPNFGGVTVTGVSALYYNSMWKVLLLEQKATEVQRLLGTLTLGINNGKAYIYLDGKAVGNGVDISGDYDPTAQTINLTQSNVTVAPKSSAQVGVSLGSQPSGNTTVVLETNSAYLSLSKSELTFTVNDWNTPQYVTITSQNATSDTQDAVVNLLIDGTVLSALQVELSRYVITSLEVFAPDELFKGSQYQMTAIVSPSDAPHDLNWKITIGSNKATIDAKTGLVTILPAATEESSITITCTDSITGIVAGDILRAQYDAPASVIYTEADCTNKNKQIDYSTGEMTDQTIPDEVRKASDYLNIAGFAKMSVYAGYRAYFLGYAFYDENKLFISGSYPAEENFDKDVPAGAAYFRFTAYGDYKYNYEFYN